MDKLHYNITVTGRVQGVFYRKYAKMQADELKIYGYAKNLPNGNVYIEAESTKIHLEAFKNWLKRGSPYSKVNSVEIEEGELKDYKSFEIR